MKNILRRNLHWSTRDAVFGMLVASVPILLILSGHVEQGLATLIGGLPAAIVGVLPTRKARLKTVFIGIILGVCLMIGSFLAQWWWLAIIGIGLLAIIAARAATRSQFGMIVLTLCLPLVGIGMSYPGFQNSFKVALLIMIGSFVAYAWSLCFKPYKAPSSSQSDLLNENIALSYGIRVGLAASVGAALGFMFHVEHIGWIVGATLLVIRPLEDLQKLRSAGRIISVIGGALLASVLLSFHLSVWVVAIVAASALVLAAALHTSRWYITPAFTTFLVFWVLLYDEATLINIDRRFIERVLETFVGVALAYVFGLLLPKLFKDKLV